MNTINLDQAFAIQNIINTMDDSVRLFPAYSGKFMFGAECAGYAVHNVAIVGIAVAQVLSGTDIDVAEVLADCRTDDLGMQTIVYFPRLQIDLDEPVTVAYVDALDASDWMEALDADSKEEFEDNFGIILEGEALAFLESIFADDVITVTNADDVDSYIDWDGLWCRDEELIPADGQVDDNLHADITRDIEATNHVKLVGDALIEFNAIMKEYYGNIAGKYDPEEHPAKSVNVTLTIDPETGAETLDYFGVIYTGEALEEFRWQNTARETLECWDRASWHYYEGLPCEHNMILALEDVPYDKFDFLEDYAWNTLTSCWKAMRAYIAQGKFSDDPAYSEAKMREVWAWLDGWHKYHNASDVTKD